MKRLLSYIKPYVWVFIAAVGLLVVQANADLALPEYMSRIVNVGIQQGGFEDPVPEYLSESTMSGLLGILEESQAQLLRQAYRAVPTDVDVDHFPDSRNQEMYRLQELTAEDRTALEDILIPGIVGLAARQYPEMAAAAAGQPREMLTQAAIQVIRGDYRAMGADLEAIRTDFIVRTGGIMLAFTLISALSAVAVGFLAARGAAGYARDLRQGLFSRVEDFSLAEFDSFSPASLLTRTTNDVMQIQMVIIMMMRMVIYAPILGIGGIIRALETSTSMWWIIALGVGLLLVLVVVVYLLAMPRFTAIQNLTDKLNLVSREGLTGMMVIRAFNRQDHENRRFDEANTNLTDTMLFVNRVMVFMMPVMMLIMNGLSVLIIWVGSHEIAGAAMQVGDMMAFLQYSMQIVMSFLMISMMFVMIPRAAVSARRVAEVLNTPPGIVDPPENEQQGLPAGAPPGIEFQGVCFRYGHAPEDVLHDISFRIEPGQTVGIIGATGSGKSTLVNLIPRFYDVTQGSIFVAGKDVRRVSQADLRRMIGYVPQRAHLFSGSIEENLRYGTDSPSEAHHREPASPDSGMQAEAESSWESGGSGKSGSTGKSGGSRKSGST
ncbi:ABC transporter ATP-binding protein, partial [Spirochaeta lutea]|uniref:ABC transporter ATP-binding protein n=1 Tax=Spirochaeta lutea TaxID=1480694 RepID=UPI0006892115